MPRAIWTGTLQFVLISFPVKLYKATDSKGVSFKTIHTVCGDYIHLKKWCNTCNREALADELNKGYELVKGQYVLFDKEEIENAMPENAKIIKIEKAVPFDEIPTIVYEDSYFISPDKGGDHVYNLLFNALSMKPKVLIGRLVMREKEHLVAIRPYQDGLLLSMLHFADEIRDIHEVVLIKEKKVDEKELNLAASLLDYLTGNFNQIDQKDKFREYIDTVAEMKATGQVITIQPVKKAAPQANIIEGLQKSIEVLAGGGVAGGVVEKVEIPIPEIKIGKGIDKQAIAVEQPILELPGFKKQEKKDVQLGITDALIKAAEKGKVEGKVEEKVGKAEVVGVIKQELDKMYGVTEEEIDRIIFEQKKEEEQERANILKELVGYKSFEEYVKDEKHKKEFEEISVGTDFKLIIISNDKYPRINLPILKKIGIVAQHFGILIFIKSPQKEIVRKVNYPAL